MEGIKVKTVEVSQDIKSPFAYYDTLAENFHFRVKRGISKDDAIAAILMGEVIKSDFFILLAIAKYTFATKSMIGKFLEYYKRYHVSLPIPDGEQLQKRLNQLNDCGLINMFSFLSKEDRHKRQHYVCLTSHGFSIIRKQLAYDAPYDEYVSGTRMDEVCKQLDTSYVLSRLTELSTLAFIGTSEKIYSRRLKAQRLYGKAKLCTKEQSLHLAVEPLYPTYDKTVLDKEQYALLMRQRTEVVIEFLKVLKDKGRDALVLVLAETENQLNNHMAYFSKHYIEYKEQLFFSTTTMIHTYGFDEGMLTIGNLKNTYMGYFSDLK